jgi:hypothetical protein
VENKLCDEGQHILTGNRGDIAVLALHVIHCREPGCMEKYLEIKSSYTEVKNNIRGLDQRKKAFWPIRG